MITSNLKNDDLQGGDEMPAAAVDVVSAEGSAAIATTRDVLVLRDLWGSGATALAFDDWAQPGRAGAAIHELYREEPEGGHAFVVRFGAGAHGDRHVHTGYEIMLVLSGTLLNDNGDRYEPGDLILEGPESIHQVSTETGATVLCVRQGRARGLVEQAALADAAKAGARS